MELTVGFDFRMASSVTVFCPVLALCFFRDLITRFSVSAFTIPVANFVAVDPTSAVVLVIFYVARKLLNPVAPLP